MRLSRNRRAGFPGLVLVELITAAAIFGALLTVLFLTYRQGALAWRKAEARTAVLADLQVCLREISRHLERSTASGVTLAPEGLSVLSALDDQGQVVFDADQEQMEWQRFFLFYLDSASKDVKRRNVPLPSATTDILAFQETFGFSVATAVATPDPEEKTLTLQADVTEFTARAEGGFGGLVRLRLKAEKASASEQMEQLELESLVRIRN